jgi:predicted ATPase
MRNGVVRLTRSADELAIPSTVQAIITARIDRLPDGQKDLLQTLSVIGTEFRLAVVRKLTKLPDQELDQRFAALQLSEFVYEQPASGDVEYIFKHVLTRDVAYNSVLKERRRLLHERTGVALKSLYAGSLDDHLARLAHHYARSGNPSKAVEYCLRACRQCVERVSYADAVAHFEAGLARLQELPDDARRAKLELDLRIESHGALTVIRGYGSRESEESASRALELCRRPGTDWKDLWLALRALFRSAIVHPELRKAHEIAAELLALAEQQETAAHLAQALGMRAFANLSAGAFDVAAVDFDRTIAVFESTSMAGRERLLDDAIINPAIARALSAWNQCFLRYFDQALERIDSATAIARSRFKE